MAHLSAEAGCSPAGMWLGSTEPARAVATFEGGARDGVKLWQHVVRVEQLPTLSFNKLAVPGFIAIFTFAEAGCAVFTYQTIVSTVSLKNQNFPY